MNSYKSENTNNAEVLQEEMIKQSSQKRVKRLPIAITEQEFIELVKVTKSEKHKIAFLLGFASGLRVSEIVKLEQRDIDLTGEKIFIRLGKGSKDRISPLPKAFKPKHLILIPLGIGVRALQKAFKHSAEASGLLKIKPEAHFHSLRHGFATHFLEKGGNIQLLKVLMGHSNIATTDIYNQLNPKIALDKYKELF